ncbi:hypothetical protein Poli38472_001457 [Pythium oligandrum]|uniref:CDC20/Fizzy WD40 domain-containing protein n=1 Tax=Pythium oligandrum TaxID=41045 RepID=A0A8K1FNE4_PYTOL|nr:hypothetical protein Poli38472_001457 [Pythium oligandrum]|eukprot:TMW69301.1 hypothetical protein Poli38472_001457 [Pythium oligandrum]
MAASRMTAEGASGLTLPLATQVLPSWHQELLLQEDSATASRKRQRFGTVSSERRRVYHSDRFIPARSAMDMEFCNYMVTLDESIGGIDEPRVPVKTTITRGSTATLPLKCEMDSLLRYQETLAANLLSQSPSQPTSILRFHETENAFSYANTSLNHPKAALCLSQTTRTRHIPSAPTRILDAPELRDDYYLNLVSWGENNVLAVALGQIVYLYHTETGAIQEIRACQSRNDYVTSVAWIQSATSSSGSGASSTGGTQKLAIGTFHAELQVWDASTTTKIRSFRGHSERIGALAWNDQFLTSGSRDSKILLYDLRIGSSTSTSGSNGGNVVALYGHEQEICGLAWSPDGKTLASGGNDNCLCLWDIKMLPTSSSRSPVAGPRQRLVNHTAAVKALAWCPWERHLLASGGGSADRTIKFWNSSTGRLLNSVHTGSQVCGLVWSKTERELLSSHGFSQNELCLWRYPTMTRIREFTGHTARVLHLAMSPDGSSVVSAAADETLRFWNVFSSTKRMPKRGLSSRDRLFPDAVIR